MARTSCLMKSDWFFITQMLFSVPLCLCGRFIFSIIGILAHSEINAIALENGAHATPKPSAYVIILGDLGVVNI